jgi:uncharacterized spore protein YtfJ
MNPEELLSGVRDSLTARRVYGDPIEHDGVLVIPAASVGGGGGGGGDSEDNGGGGFGLGARPVGAYVIKDGEVSWKPVIDVGRMLLGWQVVAGIAALALWAFARRQGSGSVPPPSMQSAR